jgi:hypothetical protein
VGGAGLQLKDFLRARRQRRGHRKGYAPFPCLSASDPASPADGTKPHGAAPGDTSHEISCDLLPRATRLRAYLARAGHGEDRHGVFLQRLNRRGSAQDQHRPLRPARVAWVVWTSTQPIGLGCGSSSHAMRTTVMTTALTSGAAREEIQRTVGHAEPATTPLPDGGQLTPRQSAAFVVAGSACSWRRSPPRCGRERHLHERTGVHGWSAADGRRAWGA